MTTRTDHRPFAPQGAPDRERLTAYAEGRLTPRERREVEAHLESDPLLREAAEGLAMPGATAALAGLDAFRPRKTGTRGGRLFLGGVILGAAVLSVVWLAMPSASDGERAMPAVPPSPETPGIPMEPPVPAPPLHVEEIATAVEQPESLHIGHGPDERHVKAVREELAAPIERNDPGLERINGGPRTLPAASPPAMRPARRARVSRQLHYLHDLAIVHPKEMYDRAPEVPIEERHLSAQYATPSDRDAAREPQRNMAYLPYMGEALGKFARNDHKGCIEDLRFLLEQYPDDVNALFYAGLCCHNLGLHARARAFLHRAATHAIDTFDEEATWYHALTLERLGEQEAAQEAFARILAGEGFYAERARERLNEQ